MSDESTTNTTTPSHDAPATDVAESTASEPQALETDDQIASALDGLSQKEQPEPEPEVETEVEQTDGEPPTEVESEAQPQSVPVPKAWEPNSEIFKQLPPDVQKAVVDLEAQRENVVKAKVAQAMEAAQHQQQMLATVQSTLIPAIEAAKQAVAADFAGIDWAALKQADPLEYIKLEGAYQQRLAAIEQSMAGARAVAAQRQQQLNQVEHARMQAEVQQVVPKLREIVGDSFSQTQFKKDVTEYLSKVAPPEHLNGITHAYQLELIAKAMAFDNMAKARAQAVKKVASAPKVQGTRGVAIDNTRSGAIASAKQRLSESPGDLDAITAYLNAI